MRTRVLIGTVVSAFAVLATPSGTMRTSSSKTTTRASSTPTSLPPFCRALLEQMGEMRRFTETLKARAFRASADATAQ